MITTSTDTGSLVAGALSGNRIDFTDGPIGIRQRVIVAPGGTYNLTFYAKKQLNGLATVSLSNNIDDFSTSLIDGTAYDWQRFTIQDFIPTSSYFDVTIHIDGDVDLFSITDLMLAKGAVPIAWQQAGGEVANESVTFDSTGITVKSNVYDGAYTKITPLEFKGYDNNGDQAFSLNNDTTEVNNLQVEGSIDTVTHSIVFLTSGPNAGMNFVVKG